MNCACGSEQVYEKCCGPLIDGSKYPESAEALMRSRYTAYTKVDLEYIKKTMVTEARDDFDEAETRKWAQSSKWKGLKIVDTKDGGPEDQTGMVEFIATFEMDGQGIDHHEVAQFRKTRDGRWLFVDGEAHTHREGESHHEPAKPVVRDKPKVGRNDACPCGSGKKYKKCCEGKAA